MAKDGRANRAQIIQIHEQLKDVLVVVSDGIVSFKEGHSDATVAKAVGCSPASVAGLRNEVFGKLFSRGGTNSEVAKQIEELQQAITALQANNLEITDKHNKLVLQLQLNHVADVKHLKIGKDEANGKTK